MRNFSLRNRACYTPSQDHKVESFNRLDLDAAPYGGARFPSLEPRALLYW